VALIPFGNATMPFAPFDPPVQPPALGPSDGTLYYVGLTGEWWALVAGACVALTVDSSWAVENQAQLNQVRKWAWSVIRAINARAENMISFRVNPSDVFHWQYSFDSGSHWIDGPNTEFPPDCVVCDPGVGQNILTAGAGAIALTMIAAATGGAGLVPAALIETAGVGLAIEAGAGAIAEGAALIELTGATAGELIPLLVAVLP
jgi:hypothetical protein